MADMKTNQDDAGSKLSFSYVGFLLFDTENVSNMSLSETLLYLQRRNSPNPEMVSLLRS
jgi:hypothetical protein